MFTGQDSFFSFSSIEPRLYRSPIQIRKFKQSFGLLNLYVCGFIEFICLQDRFFSFSSIEPQNIKKDSDGLILSMF
jgi:hypothetical protein